MLLEPQSTNLVTYSEDYTDVNTWAKGSVTLDSNDIISPDGTKNASKLIISGGTPYLGNTKILTAGNTYTVSCFVKKGTNRWIRLANITSGSTGAWFDLENNVVGNVNSISASIENYVNGWYRIQNTFIAQSGSANTFLGLSDSDNQTSSTQIGNTVYVWGFQVEESSYATSYIPSLNGTPTTRLGETLTGAGSSDLINSEEGVLYAEVKALADDGTVRMIIEVNDNSNNNRVSIFINSNNYLSAYVFNGTVQYNYSSNINALNFHKLAFKYKENNFSFFIDGIEVNANNSGTTFSPNTLNKLQFSDGVNGANFYGKAKCVAVFKEALSDSELECLTKI